QAGVEEADESGDDLAGAVAALADQVQGGGVARGGSGGDNRRAERAVRLQPGREVGGPLLLGGLGGVRGEGRAGEVGLQAAPVAAGARVSVGHGLDVPDVARAAGRPAVDLAADDDAAADAGADLDAEEVGDGAGDARV